MNIVKSFKEFTEELLTEKQKVEKIVKLKDESEINIETTDSKDSTESNDESELIESVDENKIKHYKEVPISKGYTEKEFREKFC